MVMDWNEGKREKEYWKREIQNQNQYKVLLSDDGSVVSEMRSASFTTQSTFSRNAEPR